MNTLLHTTDADAHVPPASDPPASEPHYVVFEGHRRLSFETPQRLREWARAYSQALQMPPPDAGASPGTHPAANILVFDASSGEQIEVGRLAGPVDANSPADAPPPSDADPTPAVAPGRGRGRPRLGVVAREITLLPRHWDWLASQPGGASVALRKLVESASRANRAQEQVRRAREACYRFMNAMAGDFEYFEEATRALYRGDAAAFALRIQHWPEDVRQQALEYAAPSFAPAAVQVAPA